jgi:hypothetical protein
MAEKPILYVDYRTGKIQGPSEVIGRLFANPKLKSWYGPSTPEATMVISDAQRLHQTVGRLRALGYPVVEQPLSHQRSAPDTGSQS